MNVSVLNLQKKWHVRRPAIQDLAEFLLQKSGKRARIEWGEVSVALVDNHKSRIVNQTHLGHDYATDVISFNFAPIPGNLGKLIDGEIVINIDFAFQFGPTYQGSDHELALYLAHGCDHLSGANDGTPKDRQRMRRRELQWLKDAKTQGLNLKLT